eukprot:CAMPEP_0170091056 /NCGR_PEP_ID=MMETSP0019_2-20121128/24744_1 /TAXON_ID=98059 /ORGANISM="Dinobryon sp., Strain UTEXLB2267" /LENGTH=262 /DNA_ID=CAMNT_0010310745 /DNA_START=180 /DNA_END=968 /DNA_ORIENTATION=-
MFRSTLVLALIAGVVAFAPIARKSVSSSLKMDFSGELGAQAPLGFWDPLGLLKNADQARFERLRTVEVKHGRISMLAILGHLITTAGNRLPGEIAYGTPFSSVKAGLAAFDSIPTAGLVQLVLFIGILENGYSIVGKSIEEDCLRYMNAIGWSIEEDCLRYMNAIGWSIEEDCLRYMNAIGWSIEEDCLRYMNAIGWSIEEDCLRYMNAIGWSAEKQRSKAAIELNNGRAAQMGILALTVHEKLNNDPYVINTLLGAPVPFN